jgi:GT2 family glycosyltransferase
VKLLFYLNKEESIMGVKQIAVLITCHNRKDKTFACLKSLFEAELPSGYSLDVYLVDDGSTDGTEESVEREFKSVNVIRGNGDLFWAGGMRLAWNTAMEKQSYDAYLLINDDVYLDVHFLNNLIKTDEFSLKTKGGTGIYSGATVDDETKAITYGGSKIKASHIIVKSQRLVPAEYPQPCEITNANILWVSKEVVDKIGVFDVRFTHGIADYDYSLRASKQNIPVFLAPNICGVCADDHGKNWKPANTSLKERVAYLKSPKGLAYNEYLYYIRKHFPLFLPYSFVMLWLKVLFPFFWERFKK